jgi:hypothetical protein
MQAAERRHAPRQSPHQSAGEPQREQLVSTIVGAYREMPGLCLTLNQAARLFGLRDVTCHIVLEDLVKKGSLRRARNGQYASPEA